ncbi:prepilin-type N-terminal cleavage/methylation domain-containing protein [Patescibacteria group bacterium]|nr:prepilin-type N-terminal cleavage/methylation domain-containing protein [Patescibacteria group bacterium]
MKHLYSSSKKGVSLIEMLVYVALITVIFLLIVNTVLSFTGSYRQLAANRELEHTAINVFERISRDIRNSASVATSTNSLTLVQTSNSVSTTTRFYLDGTTVKVDINGTYYGPLSVTRGPVTNLTFTIATSTGPDAVKIDMTAQGISGTVIRTKTFHTTIIAKES